MVRIPIRFDPVHHPPEMVFPGPFDTARLQTVAARACQRPTVGIGNRNRQHGDHENSTLEIATRSRMPVTSPMPATWWQWRLQSHPIRSIAVIRFDVIARRRFRTLRRNRLSGDPQDPEVRVRAHRRTSCTDSYRTRVHIGDQFDPETKICHDLTSR